MSLIVGVIRKTTNLKRALSSENPEARASTASGVPMFLKPNIARYRSKRGRFGSKSFACRLLTVSSVIWSGFAGPDRRPEVGGAGSIEVYVLIHD